VKPLRSSDLTLSAEYTRERTRNPILNISAATAATMAAFPDRYTTSAEGYLTSMDLGPVNGYRRDRQQVRWGLSYSTAFGAAWPAGAKAPGRDQFQIALYDTWRLQDDVVLRNDLPSLDLLGHDIISDQGGTPTHEIELQTSVSTRAWSVNANLDWQTDTSALAGIASQDRLTFSQGVQLGLKLQLNLEEQHWLIRRLPFLRGYLNISADNLLGAHTRVHDSSGGVPPAYSDDYLHPTGPTFRLTLRKHFR
jgi:iron complex outermembrane receptor protein